MRASNLRTASSSPGFRKQCVKVHVLVFALQPDYTPVALDHPLGVPRHVIRNNGLGLLQVLPLG